MGNNGCRVLAMAACRAACLLCRRRRWEPVFFFLSFFAQLFPSNPSMHLQGRLLLLATELLPLGSLREALQRSDLRRELRWDAG